MSTLRSVMLLSALTLGGCLGESEADFNDLEVEAQSQAISSGTAAASTLFTRSVVSIDGCSAALVTPDTLLTAGHCIDSLRVRPAAFKDASGNAINPCTGASPNPACTNPPMNEWEDPSSPAWYKLTRRVGVRVGVDRSAPLFSTTTDEYKISGGNDVVLLHLAAPVPATAATPLQAITDEAGGGIPGAESDARAGGFATQWQSMGWGVGSAWRSRALLDTTASKQPVCLSTQKDSLDCLVFGGTNQASLYHVHYDTTVGWQAPALVTIAASVGGHAPGCVSFGPGRIDCFWKSTNDVRHAWFANATWRVEGWEGSAVASAISCTSWGPGRLDCFARSSSNSLLHTWWDNGTRSVVRWANLGRTNLSGSPACTSWGDGRLDCFARDAAGAMQHLWYERGRFPFSWETRGTSADFTGDPTLISYGSGTLGAFMRKSNGDILELRYSDLQWTEWTKFGTGTHTPQCVSWADGRMDCVVNPKDATWYAHNFFDGRWHSWGAYDGIYEAGAVPSIVAWAEGRLDLFYVSSERRLRHKWFDGGWSISSHEAPGVLQQVNTVFSYHESEGNKFYMDGASVARTLPGDSGSPLMLRLTKNGVTTYKVAGVCQGYTGMLSRYISTFGFGNGSTTKDVGAWLELHLPASQVGRAR